MKEPIFKGIESEVIREIKDESIGLHGFLVINSRVNGLTCGGVRIHEDISVQKLQDHLTSDEILHLAKRKGPQQYLGYQSFAID